MEIYTNDLFDFNISSARLQNNFQLIATLLKELQQQITTLSHAQQIATESIAHNQQQLQWVINRTQEQHTLIYEQQNRIEQLNAQFGGLEFLPPEMPNSAGGEGQVKVLGELHNHRQSQQIGSQPLQPSRPAQKNGLQEMLSNIKQRLRILQKDSQHKDIQIQELSKLIPRAEHKQKRVSIVSKEFTSKNKLSKRELKDSHLKLQLKEEKGEEPSENYMHPHNQKMIPAQQTSEEEMGETEKDKIEDVLIRLSRDVQKMKEAMGEKNRILDSHMKENHQKMQSLERNMDILERSHDMLKYDFERTSTSFTKTSPHEHRRHEDRLNDTRVSNKEYYEDKLVELLNDMEFLKNEYFELQSKLEKEVENEPEEDKNARKARIGQRLMGSQRTSQDSSRGEMMLQRQELKRLRQEFQSFAMGVNTGSSQVKTILIKPNENKEDWKSLSTKMQKLKMEVNSAVRELEGKIVSSNEMVVEFNQIGVAIEECKLLLKRKVEQAEFDKSNKRMQAKLSHFMMQLYEKQGQESQFDAAIAKQPWFCLSCDSQLKNYTGKVQKSNANGEKLLGRKVNTESHMVRRNENGRLPSVVK